MRFFRCLVTTIVFCTLPVDCFGRTAEGGFGKLVDAVLNAGYSQAEATFDFNFLWNKKRLLLHISLYDSRRMSGSYDHNCVAVPQVSAITCDLSLVDELIDELHLVTHWQHGTSIDASRSWYRKNILKWILGHELGHIVLGDGIGDFAESPRSFRVFDGPQQTRELRADAFAINFVGNLSTGPSDAYQVVLSIANSLLRKAVCPTEYPDVCSRMPVGVGLIFDYTDDAHPIQISLGGDHPDMIARFLRILYLAGVGTHENSINYLARKAIEMLCVNTGATDCESLRSALGKK